MRIRLSAGAVESHRPQPEMFPKQQEVQMATTYFANTVHASAPQMGQKLVRMIGAWFKDFFCLLATYRLRRELAALDDRLLSDIGLNRETIKHVYAHKKDR